MFYRVQCAGKMPDMLQLKFAYLEPVQPETRAVQTASNKRNNFNEKSQPHNEEQPLFTAARGKPMQSNEGLVQPHNKSESMNG